MKAIISLLPKERRDEWLRWVLAWILVILLANSLHTLAKYSSQPCVDPRLRGTVTIANKSFCLVCDESDSSSYIYPWINWLNHGVYWEDCRTPVYGAPYFFLYLLSPHMAPFGIYVLQVLGLAILYASLMTLLPYAPAWGVGLLAILYASLMTYPGERLGIIGRIILVAFLAILPLTFYYTRILLTESLTATLVGLGTLALQSERHFLAGLCITTAGMMKPVYFILLPIHAGYLLLIPRTFSVEVRFRQAALYGMSLLFTVAPWTLRNWIWYGELRPAHGSGTTHSFVIFSDDLIKSRIYFQSETGLLAFQQNNECLAIPKWILYPINKSEAEMKHLLFSSPPSSCEEKLEMASRIDTLRHHLWKHYGWWLVVLRIGEFYKSLLPLPSNGYWCNTSKKQFIFLSSLYFFGLLGAILPYSP
ncbi:MAG: hypothetical protein ABDH91_08280 [Bacteroidia bacterium]